MSAVSRARLAAGLAWFTILVAMTTVGAQRTRGRSFHVIFSGIVGSSENPTVYITSSGSTADVNIDIPNQRGFSFSVSDARPQELTNTVRAVAIGKTSNKIVTVTSTEDISVYGVNQEARSSDGFLALPDAALGREYYAVTYKPDVGRQAQVVVATIESGVTRVSFAIPQNHNIRVLYNSQSYRDGDILTVELTSGQSFTVRSDTELTGLRVYADKKIGVYSGNEAATIRTDNADPDHIVAQLPPVSAWGRTFATLPLPRDNDGDILKIVASERDTIVNIQNLGEYTLANPGDFSTVDLPRDTPFFIDSNKPIMVVQFGRTITSSDRGDATMILIPPIEQYDNAYYVTSVETSRSNVFTSYALVTVEESRRNRIFLQTTSTQRLSDLAGDWRSFGSSSPAMVGRAVVIPSSSTRAYLYSDGRLPFGVVMYGQANYESYGFPAGMRVNVLNDLGCSPQPQTTDDGRDNDCDGATDEELCDGQDNDNDGYIDEDCTSLAGPRDCSEDYEGREFYLMFPKALQQSNNPQIAISTTSNRDVRVTISAPEASPAYSESVTIRPGESRDVSLPARLQQTTSGTEFKGIYVRSESADDITVTALNRQPNTCGGFAVLPLESLGEEYLVMNLWPKSDVEEMRGFLSVVSTDDDIDVTVDVLPDKGTKLRYGGSRTDTLNLNNVDRTFRLFKYQTLQLIEDGNADITGTRITASGKVAVFSGVVSDSPGDGGQRDHIVEQMTPTKAYGYRFALVPIPGQSEVKYKILARDGETFTSVTSRRLGQRDFEYLTRDDPGFVLSTKPLLVAMVVRSQAGSNTGSPSMVLVPPVEQYANTYTFSVPRMAFGEAFTSYVMIAVQKGREDGVRVDGNPVSGSWREIPDAHPSLVSIAELVGEGFHRLTHTNSYPFGAYVYSYRNSEVCGAAYVAGMCVGDLRGTIGPTLPPTRVPPTTRIRTPGPTATPQTTRPVSCSRDYVGSEFHLMFMESAAQEDRMYLFLTSASSVRVTANILASQGNFQTSVNIFPEETRRVDLPGNIQTTGTTLTNNGIYVSVSGGEVSITGVNGQRGGCGGFRVLPLDALGVDYYAMAIRPNSGTAQIGIVATEPTDVTVTVRAGTGVNLVYNGNALTTSNPSLTISMRRYDTVQMKDTSGDITGTRIQSSRKIAVFCGSLTDRMRSGVADHVVEQLPPTETYGTKFIVLLPPNQQAFYYKVVGNTDQTSVNVQPYYLAVAGEFGQSVRSSVDLYISADQPVQVVQLIQSQADSRYGAPSMILIPSLDQYQNDYTFTLPYTDTNFNAYVMIAIERGHEDNLVLNGAFIRATWRDVPNAEPEMVGGYVSLTSSSSTYMRLYTTNGKAFGAYIVANKDSSDGLGCTVAYIVGQCLDDIRENIPPTTTRVTTRPTAGPTTATTRRPTITTRSTTPRTTTTRATSPPVSDSCRTDYIGSEFFLMFMESEEQEDAMYLYLSSASSAVVITTISTSGLGFERTLDILPSETRRVDVPGNTQTTGTSLKTTGIYVRTVGGDISVSALNGQRRGCGGFRVLPVNALGYRYRAMAIWPNDGTAQLGVVATETADVTVTTLQGKGVNLRYNGQVIGSVDKPSITVRMRRYDTIQMQDTSGDITGTLIESPRKIAVFSGSLRDNMRTGVTDHVIEQLIPTRAFGKRFAILRLPGQSSYYYKVSTGSDDTSLNVQPNYLNLAGEFVSSYQTFDDLFITADRPVQVVQIVESQPDPRNGAPSMVLIPSLEQYKNQYIFNLPYTDGADDFDANVMITIERGFEQSLLLNGVSQSVGWRDIPNSNPPIVGGYISLTSAIYRYIRLSTTTGKTFGAYVVGNKDTADNRACSFAYQAGQCLADINGSPPVTTRPTTRRTVTPSPTTTTTSRAPPTPATATTTRGPVIGPCTTDYTGTNFYITFLQNVDQRADMALFVSAINGGDVSVVVEAPRANPPFYERQFVRSTATTRFAIPARLQIIGTGYSGSAVHVEAGAPVAVTLLNRAARGCGATNVIPLPSLGTEYYILSSWPGPANVNRGQLALVGTVDGTQVTVTIQEYKGVSLEYSTGELTTENPTNTFTLDRNQVLMLQDTLEGDITGTKVISSEKIAVFAGVIVDKKGPGTNTDHMEEQMPPIHTFGKRYIVVRLPDQVEYEYKILGRNAGTNLNVEPFKITRDGGFGDKFIHRDDLYISAEGPVMVAQFIRSRDGRNTAAPSMVLVPSVEQYRNRYLFHAPLIPTSTYVIYLMLSIGRGQESGLRVDGSFPNLRWRDVPSSDPPMVAVSMEVQPGVHTLDHDRGEKFGAYIYGYQTDAEYVCAFAYSAGMCLNDIVGETLTKPTFPPTTPPTTTTTTTRTTPSTTRRTTPSTTTRSSTSSTTRRTTESTTTRTTVVTLNPTRPAEFPNRLGRCAQSNSGRDFVLLFPESETNNVAMAIYAVSANRERTVDVEVYNPRKVHGAIAVSIEVPVGTSRTVFVSPQLMVRGSRRSNQAIRVRSLNGNIAVYAVSSATGACGAYVVYPVSSLSDTHYSVSRWPDRSGVQNHAQLAVIAVWPQPTEVRFYLRGDKGVMVRYDGQDYRGGDILTIQLDQYEAVQLQDAEFNDLGGTKIEANHPVAAFSGNLLVKVGSGGSEDSLMEQLPPVSAWGSHYAIVPTPERTFGDELIVTAHYENTNIKITGESDFFLSPGDFRERIPVRSGQYTIVSSNKPIMVAQIIKSNGAGDVGEPSMMMIPSIQQFRREYDFVVPAGGNYRYYLMLVSEYSRESGLRLDNTEIITNTWVTFPDLIYYVGTAVSVYPGFHRLRHVFGDVSFGAYLYGREINQCGVAYPVGMCLDDIRELYSVSVPSTSPTTPITSTPSVSPSAPSTSFSTSPSAPSSTSPTATPGVCTRVNTGREFLVMFMQNTDLALTLDIYAASEERTVLAVTITTPALAGAAAFRRTLRIIPGGSSRISIPTSLMSIDTEINNAGIRISSTGDVAVHVVSVAGDACGGFMALPFDGLSTEYYALAFWPTVVGFLRHTQIGIVATQDNTQVTIRIPTGTDSRVPFRGVVYVAGDTMRVTLNAYQALQIQDSVNEDLTGARIEATNLVAVFSGAIQIPVGNSQNVTDHLIEQMPPVRTWGRRFFLAAVPGRFVGDYFTVMAHQDDTVITLTGSGSFTLDAGFSQDSLPLASDTVIEVRSTKPVLIAQYVKGSVANDPGQPSMFIVPPVEQYRTGYRFNVPLGRFRSYVAIVIERSKVAGLLLDFNSVSSAGWTSIVGLAPEVSANFFLLGPGSHTLRHTDGDVRFGAYVYGLAQSNCGYAYPAGMCLDDIQQEFSSSFSPRTTVPTVALSSGSTFRTPSTSTRRPFSPSVNPSSSTRSSSGFFTSPFSPSGSSSSTFSGVSTSTSAPVAFRCPPEILDDYFEDPNDCSAFYRCVSGVASHTDCPTGLHFSIAVKNCLPRDQAGCDIQDGIDYLGKTFVLMVPGAPTTIKPKLYITTPRPFDVIVRVTLPGINAGPLALVSVRKGFSETVELPIEILSQVSGETGRVVVVEAGNLVTVTVLNQGSCASYLALPEDALQRRHYVLTWQPSARGVAFVGVVAPQAAVVTIVPVMDVVATVTYGAQTLRNGVPLIVSLERYRAAMITADGNLSGTLVIASVPVAVFGGNMDTQIGFGSLTDQIVTQYPSSDTWGITFALTSIPEATNGYYIKVVALDSATSVSITGKLTRVLDAGDIMEENFIFNDPIVIRATNKVMVTQFVQSPQSTGDFSGPASLYIPPVEQFRSDYFFTVPALSTYKQYILVAIENAQLNGLLLDGVPVDTLSGWRTMFDAQSVVSTKQIRVYSGAHRLRHRLSTVKFGAYIYGALSGECAHAFPAGMNLVPLTSFTTISPPTGFSTSFSTSTSSLTPSTSTAPGSTTPSTSTRSTTFSGFSTSSSARSSTFSGFSTSSSTGPSTFSTSRSSSSGSTTRSTFSFFPSSPFSSTASPLSSTPTPTEFVCPAGATGYFPNAKDCQRYYVCLNGLTFNIRCPSNLFFDSSARRCVGRQNARCFTSERNTFGKSFPVLFTHDRSKAATLQVIVSTDKDVTVTIRAPVSTTVNIEQSFNLVARQSRAIDIPGDLRAVNSGQLVDGILVEATEDVSVQTFTKGSCSGTLTIPRKSLGRSYGVLTWQPMGSTSASSMIGIMALEDGTDVRIQLGPYSTASIRHENGVYTARQFFDMTLNRNEAYKYRAVGFDLSGVMIYASKPVSVVVGSSDTVVVSGLRVDELSTQMPPVESWGTEFVLPVIPQSLTGSNIKVLAAYDNTQLTVLGDSLPLQAGQYVDLAPSRNDPIYISSSLPILVVLYVRGPVTQTDRGGPASMLIPAAQQFMYKTVFTVPNKANTDHYITLVMRNSDGKAGVLLDGNALSQDQWIQVRGSSDYIIKTFTLAPGHHDVYHTSPTAQIGVLLYGSSQGDCAYGMPAGMKLDTIILNVPQTTLPPFGSTVPSFSPSSATSSSTTSTPTTSTEPPELKDSMGMDFFVGFLHAPSSSQRVEIAVTTESELPVDVLILPPQPSQPDVFTSFQVNKGSSETVMIPGDLKALVDQQFISGMRVIASQPVSVQAYTVDSCSAMLVLPTENLGTKYWGLTWPPVDSGSGTASLIVVAVQVSNTQVTVHLGAYAQAFVQHQGRAYNAGESFSVQLGQFESYKISSIIDLSGISITADKLIAVFAGTTDTYVANGLLRDDLASQLHPVTAWGKEFAIPSTPAAKSGSFIKVIADRPDTVVDIYGTQLNLQEGEFRQFTIGLNSPAWITSNKPIMIVQYVRGPSDEADRGGPAAIHITPTQQFLGRYHFTVPVKGNQFTYVIIVAPRFDLSGLKLDGSPVSPTGWSPVTSSLPPMVTKSMPVVAGYHSVTHSDPMVKIGVYMYGTVIAKCSYGLPAGTGLNALTQASSSSTSAVTTPSTSTTTAVTTPPSLFNDNTGLEFFVTFTHTPDLSKRVNLVLTTESAEIVIATIQTLEATSPSLQQSVVVTRDQAGVVVLPGEIRSTATAQPINGVRVVAPKPVAVYMFVDGSCSAALVFPVQSLGTDYYVLSYDSPSGSENTASIMAVFDNTQVSVESTSAITIEYGGRTYTDGATLSLDVDALQAHHIKANDDISGLHVTSTKPVAVFSSSSTTFLLNGAYNDDILTSMIPVPSWGVKFAIPGIPQSLSGYVVKVIAMDDDTRLFIFDQEYISIKKAESAFLLSASNDPLFMRTDKPVQVNQYALGPAAASPTDRGGPASVLIPSLRQFKNSFVFHTLNKLNVQTFLVIVTTESSQLGLRLNDQELGQTDWLGFIESSPPMVTKYFSIDAGKTYRLRHIDPTEQFMAYLYGTVPNDCAYGLPLGMQIDGQATPSTSTSNTPFSTSTTRSPFTSSTARFTTSTARVSSTTQFRTTIRGLATSTRRSQNVANVMAVDVLQGPDGTHDIILDISTSSETSVTVQVVATRPTYPTVDYEVVATRYNNRQVFISGATVYQDSGARIRHVLVKSSGEIHVNVIQSSSRK